MSLWAAMVKPERAVLCTDSIAISLEGAPPAPRYWGHISKAMPLPSLHAVLVLRGSVVAQSRIVARLIDAGEDDIARVPAVFAAAGEEAVELARDSIPEELPPGMDADQLGGISGALIGWSHSEQSMTALMFDPALGHRGDTALGEMVGCAPLQAAGLPEAMAAYTDAEPSARNVQSMAETIFAHFDAHQRQLMGLGGHLHVAEIDRDGINVAVRRDFFEQRQHSDREVYSGTVFGGGQRGPRGR